MDSKQIIRTFYVIGAIYTFSASLIWGVNTLFLLDAGLDIFGVFLANSVFTASMVIFEVPTGVVADTSGRRISFLLSTLVLCLATFGYVGVAMLEGGLFLFCLMSVFLGLGFTFYSGAVEAWLVDALNASGYEGKLDPIFARSGMISGVLMLIGTVAGGFIGTIDLAIPYLGRSLLLAIVLVWGYLYMHDIGYRPRALTFDMIPAEMRKVARESLAYGWQKQPVRLLMVVSLIQSLYFMWGFYATQPYFLDLLGEPEAVWVSGLVAALVSITMIVGSGLVGRLTSLLPKRTSILIPAAGVLTISTVLVGLVDSFWLAVPLFLLSTLTYGVAMPVKQAYLHQIIPSAQRATVVSFDAMFSSVGGMVGQTGLGYLARQRDIASGFVVGGAVTILAIPVLLMLRALADPADAITASTAEAPPLDLTPEPIAPGD
jgi:MFS family permease